MTLGGGVGVAGAANAAGADEGADEGTLELEEFDRS